MEKTLFTGIVEKIGKIKEINSQDTGEYLIKIECRNLKPEKFTIGDSISVNGICLTVVKKTKTYFETLASRETLNKTNLSTLDHGSHVNLERAMKANSRFGGHIVSGHIDLTASVSSIKNSGKSYEYWFKIKKKFNKYIISKGSIAIDGISLTVNEVRDDKFSVNIIPHTSNNTTSNFWKIGSKVNLEFDMIAKYVEKMVVK